MLPGRVGGNSPATSGKTEALSMRPSFLHQPLWSSDARKSFMLGPQTHRLPFHVMWGITMLTSLSMAIINFITILSIEYLVKFKFGAMAYMITHSGLASGIGMLTAISVFFGLVGVCLIQFVAPSCGGSGLPENKCYLNGSNLPGFFTRRTLRVRVATTILANAAGYPVGREGPTVVIGSNVAYLISKAIATPYVMEWLDISKTNTRPALLVDEERFAHATRINCAVGGACGMAMIFNAPFGGYLYMFEEITSVTWPLELTFRVFVATMSCAFVSYGLLNLCGTDIREFVIYAFVEQTKEWQWIDIPLFIFMAALLGVLSSLHTRGMLMFGRIRGRIATRLKRYQPWARILETMFYCALCALASVLASLATQCVKEGASGLQYVAFNCEEGSYNPTASLLINTSHSAVKLLFDGTNAGEISARASLLAFATYYALNVGLTGLPVPGGAFTATMLLGGLFGRGCGDIFRYLGMSTTVSGIYAVVGSAAMLCVFKQMTLAVVLIVVECVNDLKIAPVVMLSVSVAMVVNWSINPRGHDEEQIHSKDLPFLEGEASPALDSVLAVSVCDPIPAEAMLPAEASEAKVRKALEVAEKATVFPILNFNTWVCIGVIKRSHLEDAISSKALAEEPPKKRVSRAFATNPFEVKETADVKRVSSLLSADKKAEYSGDLPLYRLMDPTPFMVLEDMPVPRIYGLFAKGGERFAVCISRECQFRGIISRASLINAARHGSG